MLVNSHLSLRTPQIQAALNSFSHIVLERLQREGFEKKFSQLGFWEYRNYLAMQISGPLYGSYIIPFTFVDTAKPNEVQALRAFVRSLDLVYSLEIANGDFEDFLKYRSDLEGALKSYTTMLFELFLRSASFQGVFKEHLQYQSEQSSCMI